MSCEKVTLKVALTGAGGQIGYSMVYMIANGDAFGDKYNIHLVMVDLPQCHNVLEGVKLELEDCGFPLLSKIDCCSVQEDAFKDIDVAILVAGAMALTEGMKRSDLLKANKEIYANQGKLLDQHAKPTCKVIVVANPANTNCFILAENAKKLPRENFSCLTRLDYNRAKTTLARKLEVPPESVKKAIVWGNHSSSMVVDHHHVRIVTPQGEKPLEELLKDEAWFKDYYIPTVRERAQAVIALRKRSSALSAAKATCDHLYNWFNGTKEGEVVSMGVLSDGSYGIPTGIVYGFPCMCKDGKYIIVKDLSVSESIKAEMMVSANELIEEKKMALE